MVRGCQKRIIYLKNTGSEVFDEAYFVVSNKTLGKDPVECDLVKEANRILDECISVDTDNNFAYRIFNFLKRKAVPFLLGTAFGTIIVLIIN